MILYYAVKFARKNACVAQLAEQLTRNEQVAGSNPATSSKKNTTPWAVSFFRLWAYKFYRGLADTCSLLPVTCSLY